MLANEFIIFQMKEYEPTNLALQLLPRQTKGVITKPGFCRSTNFYSNIFEIKLKKDASNVYQYVLDISPELPTDSDGLIEKVTRAIHYDLKKNLGLICSRGFMVWGRKQMKTVLTCKAQIKKNQQILTFDVLVKPTKQMSLESFMGENMENLPSISQVLNINTKQRLREEGMIELYPGSYFANQKIDQNKVDGNLNVWRGFDITVSVFNKKLFLQVDPCSRVLRDQSFFYTIESERKKLQLEEISLKYKGSPVLRRYGTPKIYRIDSIDFKQNPNSLFYSAKEGKEISYLDYYKKAYSVIIKVQNQPLLKVAVDKKGAKNKKQGDKEFIYLVPELVSLTGLTDQQRQDFRTMKNLAQFTKLSPAERMKDVRKMITRLQNEQELIFEINENPRALQGFKMDTPTIILGKRKIAEVRNGNMNIRQRVLDPYSFVDVIFCYSTGQNPKDDQADADDAVDLLQKAGKTFGIEISNPIFVEVKKGNRLQDWTQELLAQKKNMKQGDIVDIVFFLLKPGEKQLYSDLKKFISYEFNVPSQMATRKILSNNSKQGLSAASKIIMQMNAKLGHPLWLVQNKHKIWTQKTAAIAGIASSKGKKGTTIGFVGTTNKDLNDYFCDCKIIRDKSDYSSKLFHDIFLQWFQNWFMKNKNTLPSVIVIFREGLNDVQARIVFQEQVKGILDSLQKVRIKTKQPNYDPAIIYMLVNKKTNSRIFEGQGKGKNMEFLNPQPGSIIFEDLSQGYKEFHLASANVREGTCTPVSFKVGYENKPEFPFEAISELAYNQCYSYYNWTGSVRVPATLQYANKLAKQYSDIGEDLKTQEKNSDLKSKLFFL